jgi:hypothetical protein
MSQTGLKISARSYVTSQNLFCTRKFAENKFPHPAHTIEGFLFFHAFRKGGGGRFLPRSTRRGREL